MDNYTNNSAYQQPQYQPNSNPYQPTNQYQPQMTGYQPQLEEPVSIGDWVGSLLLFSLVPCVGLILCIVWAFSKNTKKSKANFCKAYLIIMLITTVLTLIITFAFSGVLVSLINYAMYY